MALIASDVKLQNSLKPQFNIYGKKAQSNLSDALGTLSTQGKTSAAASGRVDGGYMDQALGRADTSASRGITDALGGVLGNASLQDTQAQQDFDRQFALANEIGALNKPSTLQEVLQGISGGAQVAAQGKGLYDALNARPKPPQGPTYGTSANPYSGYNLTNIAGYALQPNELNNYGRGGY